MRLYGSAALLAVALLAVGCEEQPATDPGQPAPETGQPNGTAYQGEPQQSPYPPPGGPGAAGPGASPGPNGADLQRPGQPPAGQEFPQTPPGAGFDQSPPQDNAQPSPFPPPEQTPSEPEADASQQGGEEND